MSTSTEPAYDEFAYYRENAEEWGLPWEGPPDVQRESIRVAEGQDVSLLRWGSGPPDLVFLHGGGQNAHTWDTVILALGRPAVAIDLPGHGHSSWRADRDYWPWSNAEAVSAVLDAIGARPEGVVGMSLGGLTLVRLSHLRPDLVPKAVVVDVTPSVNQRLVEMTLAERGSTALIAGPKVYDSFEAIVEATVAMTPNRPFSAVRRGVLHNSMQLPDGKWRWRYDIGSADAGDAGGKGVREFTGLWEDVDAMTMPTMLVRGADSKFVLDDHEAEFLRRQPDLVVERVPSAGHAVQSDQPLVLRSLIDGFVFG